MKKFFYQTNFKKTKINLNQIYLNKIQIKFNFFDVKKIHIETDVKISAQRPLPKNSLV